MPFAPLLILFTFIFALASGATPKCGGNEVCVFVGFSKGSLGLPPGGSVSGFVCPAYGELLRGVSPGSLRGGVELSVALGSPVVAAGDGVVLESGFDLQGLGRFVVVLHSEDPRLESVYGFLSRAEVRAGDKVNKGQRIGSSGDSGSAGVGAKVYFELKSGGRFMREAESVCARKATPPAPPPSQPAGQESGFGYDVSSRSEFAASTVNVIDVASCARATEQACPPKGTAQFRARTWKVADHACVFRKASALFHVPYSLLRGLWTQESGGNQFAVSIAGASGYAQLMPGTAAGMGIGPDKLFDPYYNICGGVHYFARQLKNFGSVECGLAAYNAGPGNVARRDPVACANHPIPETNRYVRNIVAIWERNMRA